MSIILAMNKESSLFDPIDWRAFKHRLLKWSESWPHGLLSISATSDNLFSERSQLSHPPRVLSRQLLTSQLQSSSVIHFFDAYTKSNKSDLRFVNPRFADLIGRINRHPVFLGVLGILPNQLRMLLKECGFENHETALQDLSRTLFFAGFRIWTKRQQLAWRHWKEIEQRRSKGSSKKRKKDKLETKSAESNCMNPFHYLHRHSNLSKQRPSRCPCRNLIGTTSHKNQLITKFVFKYASKPSYGSSKTESNKASRINCFSTRTDDIRRQHDRGKKHPFILLF